MQKTTYFYGSTAARRHNIEVATANFHGLVIPPGDVFSFNEWLGDVSAETGYEQGLIIVGSAFLSGRKELFRAGEPGAPGLGEKPLSAAVDR